MRLNISRLWLRQTKSRRNLILPVTAGALFIVMNASFAQQRGGSNVFVIAESVSTSIEARRIMRRNGWQEASFRQADFILVVVRSMLWSPLTEYYENIEQLRSDASSQMNISGSNFVVYIFDIGSRGRPIFSRKIDYPARD